ncbi:hypothetical protein HYC85_023001 [Camellia sinensis]|uniref:TFIIS N-terminal domain-containing protein n=1 Tax=Camellia sinensis TaxID=4442 RepID=A0A7J7GD98_CAMSI|nr:hypothetical protein HYC85_023001 [Camellia sinensis]
MPIPSSMKKMSTELELHQMMSTNKGSRSNCEEARAAMWFKTFMSTYCFIPNYTRELSSFGNSVLLLTFLHHLRDIKDPEHPYSLEELKVISEDAIEVDEKHNCVRVTFTPAVEHCSMATVIGLCLRVKLMRSLPMRYKVDIRVVLGTLATKTAKEGEDSKEIDQLFKSGKKSAGEISLLVENVMAELEVVAEEDAELNRQLIPAINKLKKLPLLMEVIMFLLKSDEETTANRRMAKDLVDKWVLCVLILTTLPNSIQLESTGRIDEVQTTCHKKKRFRRWFVHPGALRRSSQFLPSISICLDLGRSFPSSADVHLRLAGEDDSIMPTTDSMRFPRCSFH